MEEPLTEELLEELLSSPDPKTFIDSNNVSTRSLSEYLQQLLNEKGLERAKVVREAGLNETFGYQIFTGARNASRDKILQIAFAMKLSLKETDRLLQAAGVKIEEMPLLFFLFKRAILFKELMKNYIALGKKQSVKWITSKWIILLLFFL